MAAVFKLDLPPMSKWVLMCLADNADNFGANIFPTITTLSQKSSIPERTLQRQLKSLVQSGVIEVVRVAQRPTATRPGRGTEYRLAFMTKPFSSAPAPNYKSCPKKLRDEVIFAFHQTCAYCGRLGTDRDPDGLAWEIDRVVPGSRGGSYTPENVALSCSHCNSSKGAKMAPVGTACLGAKRVEMGANEIGTGAIPVPMGAIALSPDPSLEPSVTVKEPSAHSRLMEFHDSRLVGGIPDAGAQGAAIKWLLKRYTPEQCEAEYNKLAGEEWRSTPVTWLTVKKHIGGDLAREIQTAPNGFSPAGEKILTDYGDWYTVMGVDGTPSKRFRTGEAFARETGRNPEEVLPKWN